MLLMVVLRHPRSFASRGVGRKNDSVGLRQARCQAIDPTKPYSGAGGSLGIGMGSRLAISAAQAKASSPVLGNWTLGQLSMKSDQKSRKGVPVRSQYNWTASRYCSG